MLLAVSLSIICSSSGHVEGQSTARGWEYVNRGQYREAIRVFTAILQADPDHQQAQQGLLRVYLETGQYEKAERAVAQFLARHPDRAALRNQRGELYLISGRYEDALVEFQRAAREGSGVDALRATLNAGLALTTLGRMEEAQTQFQKLVAYYNSRRVIRADELTLIAQALAHVERYHEANELYLDAIERDPTYIDAYLCAGELYIEKYNYAEAASFFRDALKINPHSARAHLGLARSRRIDGGPMVWQALERALNINPHLVDAYTLKAALHLEADQFREARDALQRALSINPRSLEAHALRAVADYLQNRPDALQQDIATVLRINPRYGQLYHTLAEFAVIHRRYHRAVEFARRAIELSPRLWNAYATLGINLLRIGQEREGRRILERAFQGDPFNLWTKNTLDLLDRMRQYRETISQHFLIKMAPEESDVLGPYLVSLLEEAYRTLTVRYRFTPRSPIICEVFPHHADFAVRTVGLPGLGALGVCFGPVIAMDSPAARPAGHFNWGSTAWHEFVHVITLQMTDYKIPRWFSEGLSVYEERRARPGWGDDWTIGSLKAFVDGRFVPIAELDGAFLRPSSPEALALAYFQASLICAFIDERFGFPAILKLLEAYKQNATTEEALARVLGMNAGEFDRAFRAYVDEITASYRRALDFDVLGPSHRTVTEGALRRMLVKNPESFFAHWRLGLLYRRRGDIARAIEHLQRAIELFPYYTGEENPYWVLAELHEQRGERRQAIAVLQRLVDIDETDVPAHNRLAWLLAEEGDVERAAAMLQRCVFIDPFDAEWHLRAGRFYLEHDQPVRAEREFRVLLALRPVDRAAPYYYLARALLAQGRRAEAKRAVLRSLEIAPGFEKAQNLLLELTGQRGGQ